MTMELYLVFLYSFKIIYFFKIFIKNKTPQNPKTWGACA